MIFSQACLFFQEREMAMARGRSGGRSGKQRVEAFFFFRDSFFFLRVETKRERESEAHRCRSCLLSLFLFFPSLAFPSLIELECSLKPHKKQEKYKSYRKNNSWRMEKAQRGCVC